MSIGNVTDRQARQPVCSVVDRVSELLFGLFMALIFVGAVSVAEAGRRLSEQTLSRAAAGFVSPAEVEAVRARIVALASVPERPTLTRDDVLASLAIFLIVVAATFPVVLPFVFIGDVGTAKSLSRAIALAMLFLGGLALAVAATARAGDDERRGRRASPA